MGDEADHPENLRRIAREQYHHMLGYVDYLALNMAADEIILLRERLRFAKQQFDDMAATAKKALEEAEAP